MYKSLLLLSFYFCLMQLVLIARMNKSNRIFNLECFAGF